MTSSTHKYQPLYIILWNVFAFGLAFTIWALALAILSNLHLSFPADRYVTSLCFALAGAVAGALLSLDRHRRDRIARLALATAAGCGLGYFLLISIIDPMLDPVYDYTLLTLADLAVFATLGAVVGTLVGLVQQGRQQALWLAPAGALGFAIGFLTQRPPFNVFHRLMYSLVGGSSLRSPFWYILWAIDGAFTGVIIGMAFGLTLSWYAARRTSD